MSHWVVGKMYKDHKRNRVCILHAMSPYKAKSGMYLNFRYLDGKYIRQSAAKALSRFEAYAGDERIDMFQDETVVATGSFAERFSTFLLDGGLFPAKLTVDKPKSKKRVSKQDVPERYANVIYIDFINKRRVA